MGGGGGWGGPTDDHFAQRASNWEGVPHESLWFLAMAPTLGFEKAE